MTLGRAPVINRGEEQDTESGSSDEEEGEISLTTDEALLQQP